MISPTLEHLLLRNGDLVLGIVGLADVCRWLLSLPTVEIPSPDTAVSARRRRTPAPPEPTRAA
jgi:hypothetical protein